MREQTFQAIAAMKRELLQMGYYPFQIDSLVREVARTTQLQQLSTADLQQVAKALEKHLAFARKCHEK